eukprot:UN26944
MFKLCDYDCFPSLVSVNGYPMIHRGGKALSHIPYLSAQVRKDSDGESEEGEEEEEEEEWQLSFRKTKKKGKIVDYPLRTLPGISGGAVMIDGCVVGIHNASNEVKPGHGLGTIFTPKMKGWMLESFSKWERL